MDHPIAELEEGGNRLQSPRSPQGVADHRFRPVHEDLPGVFEHFLEGPHLGHIPRLGRSGVGVDVVDLTFVDSGVLQCPSDTLGDPLPVFSGLGDVVGIGGRARPEQLDAEIWVEVDYLYGFDVAGGSLIYAYAERPNPAELVLMDLETRESRRLTDNDVRDYVPRFGPDARFATFVSLMSVKISTTPFSVPRVLSLPVK